MWQKGVNSDIKFIDIYIKILDNSDSIYHIFTMFVSQFVFLRTNKKVRSLIHIFAPNYDVSSEHLVIYGRTRAIFKRRLWKMAKSKY